MFLCKKGQKNTFRTQTLSTALFHTVGMLLKSESVLLCVQGSMQNRVVCDMVGCTWVAEYWTEAADLAKYANSYGTWLSVCSYWTEAADLKNYAHSYGTWLSVCSNKKYEVKNCSRFTLECSGIDGGDRWKRKPHGRRISKLWSSGIVVGVERLYLNLSWDH